MNHVPLHDGSLFHPFAAMTEDVDVVEGDADSVVIALADVIACIRDSQRIAKSKAIGANTMLERDLGITGDDGHELLQDLQKRFGVSFLGTDGTLRKAFGLHESEYLFHSEGFDFLSQLLGIFGICTENVKPLSVGDLQRDS